VPVVSPALLDPAAEEVALRGAQRELALRRGHALVGVVGQDAPHELARFGVARHDGEAARFAERRDGTLGRVEPESRFAAPLVGPVTAEAAVGEERPDLEIEVDGPPLGFGAEPRRERQRRRPRRQPEKRDPQR
jgi:hypothetical protein